MSSQEHKQTLAIDFDNTICDSRYPDCGPPIPGAKEALEQFRAAGYYILIYSARASNWFLEDYEHGDVSVSERPAVAKMREWLDEHGFPYDEIDDSSKGKPPGLIIDDKAIRFERNWPEIAAWVARNRPQ